MEDGIGYFCRGYVITGPVVCGHRNRSFKAGRFLIRNAVFNVIVVGSYLLMMPFLHARFTQLAAWPRKEKSQ